MSRIEAVRLKLEWAKHHIRDLDSEITAFIENAYTIGVKPKPEIFHVLLYVEDAKPIPSSVSLRIGDAIHNLRSTLDHLVWQLVEVAGNTPTGGNEFPIFKTCVKGGKQDTATKIAGKIKGVSIHCE